MSRLRRWRALVRKREPIVVEHEPTAWTIVAKREPEPAAVGEPDADGCRAATLRLTYDTENLFWTLEEVSDGF